MNIVLIADGHPREWPILQEVSRQFPEAVWIQPIYEEEDPQAGPSGNKSVRERMGWFYRQFRDRVRRKMTQWKVGVGRPEFKNKVQVPYFNLDRSQGLDLLDSVDPEVIVTCRAPILGAEVLKKAHWCGINVHFGLVPHYRGNEGLFWATLRDDVESLGGSIHMLEEGVDTGSVIVDAFPELTGNESETMIDLKVSDVLARALVQTLHTIKQEGRPPVGKPQKRKGRNYRAHERTLVKDVQYYSKRLRTSFAPQEERMQFY